MKGKLFKKIAASASIVAMLGTTCVTVPINADAAVGDTVTVLNEPFNTTSVNNPADLSYTWGSSLSGNLTANGLLMSNGNNTNNNYSDRELVSFASAKGNSTNKIDISYDVAYESKSKGQDYTNFTMSYYNASGKLMFSITESIGEWNDIASIKYAETNSSTKEVSLPTHIGKTVNAEVTYDDNGGYLTVDDETYNFTTDTGIKDIKLTVSGGQDYDRGIYIKNYKMTSTEVKAVTYKSVTYSVNGNTSTETVISGECVNPNNIPDTTNHGYVFKGWCVNNDTSKVISTDELKAYVVQNDVTFTAVYEIDTAYVEKIISAEITGDDSMTFGPDPDTAANNEYSVVLKGENGTAITESNISSLVKDFNVAWDIDGFATKNDMAGQYCDSYGAFTVNNQPKTETVFALRNVPMNFFGKMTATVTYNGSVITASKYVTALGDKSIDSSMILPTSGYPSVFSDYPEALIGYKAVVSGNNQSGNDTITGNFFLAGSDGTREAVLSKDADNTKYFHVIKNTRGKSGMFAHQLSVNNSQVLYKQRVRFNSANNLISFTRGYPVWSSASGYAEVANLSFTGSGLTLNKVSLLNGENAAQIQSGIWYDIIISIDPSSNKAYANVYTTDGTLVGTAENVPLLTNQAPTYYSIGTGNSGTGTVDFAGYSIYYPTADMNNYSLTASQDTLSIPNGDTADIAASLKTAEGYELTGLAVWSVVEEDMKDSIIITPDENDSHKAKITLSHNAQAGEATVQVVIGGYTKSILLNITSSAESIKFTKSNTSVSIPLDDTTMTAEYAAIVVSGDGTELSKNVELSVYDKNNTAAYTLPSGILFDTATGILTVEKTAPVCTFTIRATGTNTSGETISRAVKVTVHGLSFDFGATTDDAVAEGYTPVGTDTAYTNTRGYGIKTGTTEIGGSASVTDANSDYLAGSFEFDANVTPGKIYTVAITYAGTLTTAYVNSDLAGYTLGENAELASVAYTFAVPTNILDLKVSGTNAKIASVTITKESDRAGRSKPVIHHVGDSTAANNGSWAYYIDHNRSLFPELDKIATFYNNGAGGRNLCTYYTQGKLAGVLNDIYPGDILMFGNMGTNGLGSYFEDDVNYYINAAESMGAKVIINSYTPHGAVSNFSSGYNKTTNTFDSWRRDSGDPITRKVAEERAANDPNYLGFVEIGKNADAAFNAYVNDYANNGYQSKDEAAQAIIASFSDHNHYSAAPLARELMLNGYADVQGIVSQIVEILSKQPVIEKPQVTVERIAESSDADKQIPAVAYMASWNANGYTASKLMWTIKNNDKTKQKSYSVDLPSTVISGGINVVAGLIIQTDDINTIGTVSAELEK